LQSNSGLREDTLDMHSRNCGHW